MVATVLAEPLHCVALAPYYGLETLKLLTEKQAWPSTFSFSGLFITVFAEIQASWCIIVSLSLDWCWGWQTQWGFLLNAFFLSPFFLSLSLFSFFISFSLSLSFYLSLSYCLQSHHSVSIMLLTRHKSLNVSLWKWSGSMWQEADVSYHMAFDWL